MAAINLLELFSGRVFRIPDYQRGYAWGEKQLIELWDDLEEIQTDKNGIYKKHYTGTIYLEESTPHDSERWLTGVKFFDVVDGQQRLTTISILLFELLKLGIEGYCGETQAELLTTYLRKTNRTGNSTIYKFTYANSDNNYNFLLNRIFEDKGFIIDENQLNLYTKNLLSAKTFLSERLSRLTYAQLDSLFNKITTSLQFDLRTIEKDLDVQAVFETMNNRGKPLSTLEKLKNRLIYLVEKLDCEEEDRVNLRRKVNSAWRKIYSCLAQNPEKILDEDEFLSAHLSLYRKPKEAVFSEKLAEERVFQMFCNKSEKYDQDESGEKEPPVTYDKIEDYIVKLSDAAPVWYQVHKSESRILKKILLLNNSKELKVFLLALLLGNEESKVTHVLQNFEKILFRNKTLWLFDERTTATWGRDLYTNEVNVGEVNQKMLDLIHSPILAQDVITFLNPLFTYDRGPKGFHRWTGLKYFLFCYEDELKGQYKETNDKVSLDDYDSTSIEHIIPQDFSANWSEVVNAFTEGLSEDKKPMARKVLLNTIGNLTILKNGKNSSLGNSGWLEKRHRFSLGSYNEIQVSKNESWSSDEIWARGQLLFNFLEKRITGLKFTAEERKKLLFYEEYAIAKLKDNPKQAVATA